MTVVLTNDDGIDAPGLKALQAAVGNTAVLVAPREAHSGCGHRVTTFEGPIALDRRSESSYAIGGTPADCTRVALRHLFPKATLVLSGINAGGNLGADIYISGTVAAAREAAFLGVQGIAISQYISRRRILNWDRAARWTARVLEVIASKEETPGTFWNVNLPDPAEEEGEPEIVFCSPSTAPLPVQYEAEDGALRYVGVYTDRPRSPGSDVDVCLSGNIALSQIRL